jgi:hypothetical protein
MVWLEVSLAYPERRREDTYSDDFYTCPRGAAPCYKIGCVEFKKGEEGF